LILNRVDGVVHGTKWPGNTITLYQSSGHLTMEIHYPGYQYLGPGTKLTGKKRPINKLDAAAKAHDYKYLEYENRGYSPKIRWSKADTDFIQKVKRLKSIGPEADISQFLFNLKRIGTRLLGIRDIPENLPVPVKKRIRALILNMKRNRGYKRKYGRRMGRRFKKRKTNSLFKKVMNIINPMRTFKNEHMSRTIGSLNKRNYAHLTLITDTTIEPPNSFTAITNAITLGLGTSTPKDTRANWEAGETYYVKSNYQWLISNNSNVQQKATIWWIKYRQKNDVNPFNLFGDSDFLQNTGYYPNNATVDSITPTGNYANDPNIASPLNYNIMTDGFLKKSFSKYMGFTKGRTLIFKPGQSIKVYYKHKLRRYGVIDLFDGEGASIRYPKGTVFPIIVWSGDILPGSLIPDAPNYTTMASGVNRGDWSFLMTQNHKIVQKTPGINRNYIGQQNNGNYPFFRETVAGDLRVFGFDNNSAATAI